MSRLDEIVDKLTTYYCSSGIGRENAHCGVDGFVHVYGPEDEYLGCLTKEAFVKWMEVDLELVMSGRYPELVCQGCASAKGLTARKTIHGSGVYGVCGLCGVQESCFDAGLMGYPEQLVKVIIDER